jgi:hypothetical protein
VMNLEKRLQGSRLQLELVERRRYHNVSCYFVPMYIFVSQPRRRLATTSNTATKAKQRELDRTELDDKRGTAKKWNVEITTGTERTHIIT